MHLIMIFFYSAVSCCYLHRKFLKSDQVKRYRSPCSFSCVLQVPFALEYKHCLVYEQLEKMDNSNYLKREVCRLSSMNSSFQFIFYVLFLSSRLPIHSITDQSWWISAEKNYNIKMLVKAYRIESIGQSITILHSKMYCKEIYWLFNTSTVVYTSEPKTIKYFPRQKKRNKSEYVYDEQWFSIVLISLSAWY